MFELRDLEQFMALVEHRNFGRAAAALGMTQPQLSRRIGALERELGATLFSRARRQIELTRQGELLRDEARALLAQAASAQRSLEDAAHDTAGQVRFATRSTSQYTLVPAAIRRLRGLLPQASVVLTGPLQGLLIEHLRQGRIDLTIVRGPVDPDGELQAAWLRSDPLVVGMHESHPLARRSIVDAADLAAEPFVEIAWYQAFGYRELTRRYCASAGFIPRVTHVVETSEMLLIAVVAGLAIALMPERSDQLTIPRLALRPLRPAPPAVDLHAVWRTADRNPAIPAFVRCLMREAQGSASAGERPPEGQRVAQPPEN